MKKHYQQLVQFISRYVSRKTHHFTNTTQPLFFVIDGNIASGKSTTINELKYTLMNLHENVTVWTVEENVDTDGKQLLEKYLAEPLQYALEFQLWIIRNKIKQYEQVVTQLNENRMNLLSDNVDIVLIDRHVLSDMRIFASICHRKGFLTDNQKQEYDNIVERELQSSNIISPDVCIYVKVPAEISFDRIHQRNRKGEDVYTREYIQDLCGMYDKLYTVDRSLEEEHEKFTYSAVDPYLSNHCSMYITTSKQHTFNSVRILSLFNNGNI
jgi:deoxyadenosine/deoxycytidine kinase